VPRETIRVFSSCPQSKDFASTTYRQAVKNVAQWSEQAGCTGMLVYTDNGIADPWLVSQIVIEHTQALCPLVAIQPVYLHPYCVAKMVATCGFMYGRRLYLNMVAGGFKNDLTALNDNTPHDKRYDRLLEYTSIIKQLLETDLAVSFEGEFYTINTLRMTPPLPKNLLPGIFMSGSSDAGIAIAKTLGATAVHYPKPPTEYENAPLDAELDCGIRIGIIARPHEDEAWNVAYQRFPPDRKGQLTHQLAMKVSDSQWHKQLSALSELCQERESPYWLVPFQNYKTQCPYLVGNYERVATEVARYIRVGYRSIILDIPPDEEELYHANMALNQAAALAT
jgi:alkanesulfonate monooxygenase